MFQTMNRRGFLKAALGSAAGLTVARSAFAAPETFVKINDSFALIGGFGANILAFKSPDGLLLTNGALPERTNDLMAFLASHYGTQRVEVLFNTDWHLENTGSNDLLGKAGTKIVAHENTKLWMWADEIVVQWQKKTYPRRAKQALPSQTFYTTGKLTFGKEEVVYGHLGQAHTDGDMYVFFPGPNILVTGDTFLVGSYPVLDWSTGGWISGLADASRTLANLADAQTKVIGGNGPVQTLGSLRDQAEMTATLKTRFYDMMKKGMSARDMVNAAPTKEFDARWGDPYLFVTNAYPGLWNHVREIGGIL